VILECVVNPSPADCTRLSFFPQIYICQQRICRLVANAFFAYAFQYFFQNIRDLRPAVAAFNEGSCFASEAFSLSRLFQQRDHVAREIFRRIRKQNVCAMRYRKSLGTDAG
jgi:hypothetical protein